MKNFKPLRALRLVEWRIAGLGLGILLAIFLLGTKSCYAVDKETIELIEEAYQNGEIDYQTSLIYKVRTIRQPELIPSKYRAKVEMIQKDATPILLEVQRSWVELSPETRTVLKTLLARPSRPYSYDSPEGHYKIHYDTSGTNKVPTTDANTNGIPDYVENLALYADSSYRTEITYLGYRIPPSDGSEGGDNKYDIYTESMPYYGYTQPEIPGPQPWNDYTSYISVHNNFIGFPPNDDPEGDQKGAMKVTVAHEYFHAVQFAYDLFEDVWFMEVSSTWMEDVAFDPVNDNYNYLPYFFNYPEISLQAETMHMYASFIWNVYLSTNFGNNLINDIWEGCIYGNAIAEINDALQSQGSSRDEEFKKFTVWNYITGTRDDGLHYEEGSHYPLIKLMRTHSAYPVINNTTNKAPDNLSANYIQFNPSGSLVNLNFSFDGQDGYLWGLKALGVTTSGGYDYTEFEFTPDDSGYVEGSIPYFDSYNYVILIPSVISTSGDNLNYQYSAWITSADTLHKVQVNSGPDKEVINASQDTSYFFITNIGVETDTYSVVISDNQGWLQNPASFYDTLDPGEVDTVEVFSEIPYDAIISSTDVLKLVSTSHSNPMVKDSALFSIAVAYLRGDANGDSSVSVSDVVFLIAYLFKGGPAPQFYDTGEVNCDGQVSISDGVYLISYLFKSGPAPCFPG
jgi:hypothetical protein